MTQICFFLGYFDKILVKQLFLQDPDTHLLVLICYKHRWSPGCLWKRPNFSCLCVVYCCYERSERGKDLGLGVEHVYLFITLFFHWKSIEKKKRPIIDCGQRCPTIDGLLYIDLDLTGSKGSWCIGGGLDIPTCIVPFTSTDWVSCGVFIQAIMFTDVLTNWCSKSGPKFKF